MDTIKEIEIKLIDYPLYWDEIYNIRKQVFILEQNVPEEEEIDAYDEISKHMIVFKDNQAVATLRIYIFEDSAKIGRVAVIKPYRKQKIASILMKEALRYLENLNIQEITLDSQIYIKHFYKSLGFKEIGSEFMDAGIKHIKMIRRF